MLEDELKTELNKASAAREKYLEFKSSKIQSKTKSKKESRIKSTPDFKEKNLAKTKKIIQSESVSVPKSKIVKHENVKEQEKENSFYTEKINAELEMLAGIYASFKKCLVYLDQTLYQEKINEYELFIKSIKDNPIQNPSGMLSKLKNLSLDFQNLSQEARKNALLFARNKLQMQFKEISIEKLQKVKKIELLNQYSQLSSKIMLALSKCVLQISFSDENAFNQVLTEVEACFEQCKEISSGLSSSDTLTTNPTKKKRKKKKQDSEEKLSSELPFTAPRTRVVSPKVMEELGITNAFEHVREHLLKNGVKSTSLILSGSKVLQALNPDNKDIQPDDFDFWICMEPQVADAMVQPTTLQLLEIDSMKVDFQAEGKDPEKEFKQYLKQINPDCYVQSRYPLPYGLFHNKIHKIDVKLCEANAFEFDQQDIGISKAYVSEHGDCYIRNVFLTSEGIVLDPTGLGIVHAASNRLTTIREPHQVLAEDTGRIIAYAKYMLKGMHVDAELEKAIRGISLDGISDNTHLIYSFIRQCNKFSYSQSHSQEKRMLLKEFLNVLNEWGVLRKICAFAPQDKGLANFIIQYDIMSYLSNENQYYGNSRQSQYQPFYPYQQHLQQQQYPLYWQQDQYELNSQQQQGHQDPYLQQMDLPRQQYRLRLQQQQHSSSGSSVLPQAQKRNQTPAISTSMHGLYQTSRQGPEDAANLNQRKNEILKKSHQ